MKVDIYTRVSTAEQAKSGYSLPEQRELLKKYCDLNGLYVNVIHEDAGYSGSKSENRPGLQSLLDDVRFHRIEAVVVWKLDRLSRSQKDTLMIIEDYLLPNNVQIISYTERLDTSTPQGMLMIGMLSGFAQFERSEIKERMQMGRLRRVKEGSWHGPSAAVPLGYIYIPGEHDLRVDPHAAEQVRIIFDLFLNSTMSMNEIRKYMECTYGKSNDRNRYKHSSIIQDVIQNPIYIGKMRFKGELYDGRHEHIIDDDTFNLAQEKYKNISEGISPYWRESTSNGGHLLTGLLYCAECGCKMNGYGSYNRKDAKIRRKYHFYRCNNSAGPIKKRTCECHNVGRRVEQLNDIILNEVSKLSENPEKHIANNSSTFDTDHRIRDLENQLETLNKKSDRTLSLYEDGIIELNELKDRIEPTKRKKEAVSKQLEVLRSTKHEQLYSRKRAIEVLETYGSTIHDLPKSDQKKILRELIYRITSDKDKNTTIEWRF